MCVICSTLSSSTHLQHVLLISICQEHKDKFLFFIFKIRSVTIAIKHFQNKMSKNRVQLITVGKRIILFLGMSPLIAFLVQSQF